MTRRNAETTRFSANSAVETDELWIAAGRKQNGEIGSRKLTSPARLAATICRTFLAGAILACPTAVLVAAPDTPAEKTDEAASARTARLEMMMHMAERYEIYVQTESQKKLERVSKPVLRWTNPVRGAKDGCLWLWTDNGRPEAIVSFYPSFGTEGEQWDHEFQSLSRGKLRAERNRTPFWTPEKPGIEFKAVPDAPPPADTAAKRSSQIRTLASRFSAQVIVREDKSALRLLTTPIYRYSDKEAGVIDGAVLVFAQGTDPELVLLLEARADNSTSSWQYALARMTSWGVEVSLDQRPVWAVEYWDRDNPDPRLPYLSIFRQPPD
jgi:hypothetical protein